MTARPPITSRPFLESLEAYVPGEQPGGGFIKLNTNEFPYPAAPEVVEAIAQEAADTVRIYPDPTATALREALGVRHGVDPDRIIVGNGSDEILRLLAHAWLDRGRRLAIVDPTYTLYEVLAAQFEAQVAVHPLVDGERLPESLFTEDWAACFLPVPNPPLGTVFPDADLLRLAACSGLLVLDGAYIDFASGHEPLAWLDEHPNLVVTRSFSKSYGLAGLRVGYAVARRALIETLHKLRDSYNVNRISQAAATAAVKAADYYRRYAERIVAARERLADDLRKRGFVVPPSQGNFLFARHPKAPEIFQALKVRRILVRYFTQPNLADGLRITIGTDEEVATLIASLDALREVGIY